MNHADLPSPGGYRVLTREQRDAIRRELREQTEDASRLALVEIDLADGGDGDAALVGSLIDAFDTADEPLLAARARVTLWEHPNVRTGSLLDEALRLYTEAGDDTGRIYALTRLGQHLAEHGEKEMARSLLKEALDTSVLQNDPIAEGRATQQLADIAETDNERETWLRRAIDRWTSAGFASAATHVLLQLARLEIAEGRYTDALASAERALEISPDATRADCHLHIGAVLAELDRADPRARDALEHALGDPSTRETAEEFLAKLPILTDEQRAKLALIVDPEQRNTLIAAIVDGDEIPAYAWTPIPPRTPEFDAAIERAFNEIRDRFGDEGIAIALDPDLLAEDDDDE